MGQYFYGVIDEIKDGINIPKAYGNPERGHLKLTEHSYWNNPYVNWFCKRLEEEPHHIGWIGDYSENTGCPLYLFKGTW